LLAGVSRRTYGFPLPTPHPQKTYQPKKKYFFLSVGNIKKIRKEPVMKQTAKKKNKVFRTLIRLIHTGEKAAQDDSHVSAAKEKNEKQPRQPPFFFGR